MNRKDLIDKAFKKAEKAVQSEPMDMGTISSKINGQNYILVFFITETIQGITHEMMKIWGSYPDEESAKNSANKIKDAIGNEIFDIYIAEMYGLATRPPNRVLIKKQVYHEEKLQEIMKENEEQKLKVRGVFDTRLDNNFSEKNDKIEQEHRKKELQEDVETKVLDSLVQETTNLVPPAPTRPPGHFDPDDELSTDDKLECLKNADKYIEELYSDSKTRTLDLMKEDVRTDFQNWALVSFTGPNLNQKTKDNGIMFWGLFDSVKDAKVHATSISKHNLDVYILEMYTWTVVPPSKEFMESQELHEDMIVKILRAYKRKLRNDTEKFNMRKQKLMSNPDVNQYNRYKNVLKEIRGETVPANEEHTVSFDKDLHEKVFGRSEKLPDFKVDVLPI